MTDADTILVPAVAPVLPDDDEDEEESSSGGKSKVELLKEGSRGLRGNIVAEMANESTRVTEATATLMKLHGTYLQDDRDDRVRARKEKREKSYSFMIRCKLPGGAMTARQYLAFDDIATTYANNTLRITTRQCFQFHGVLKRNLKTTFQAINDELVTTMGACGDVVRNWMACPAPAGDRVAARIMEYAQQLSDHTLPKTRAYHEIWLNGEKLVSTEETEDDPLYQDRYLPRKFKCGFAFPGDNCIDVYSQDIGIVPVLHGDQLAGFTIIAGGGLGMTHGKAATHPRLGDALCFIAPDELTEMVETIVGIQRDYGDRANRRHARMKYLMDEWGVEKFRAELERRLGRTLEPPGPLEWHNDDDHMGWRQQADGRWYLGVWVENGRIADVGDLRLKSGFRALLETLPLGARLTPHQSILFTDIEDGQRATVEAILKEHGIPFVEDLSLAVRYSMACPALPTCGLAVAEAERVMPKVVRQIEGMIAELGLADEQMSIRMSGCPNGCSRPFIGDIGFVGRTLNKYQIYLGGDFQGTRLNRLYRDMVPLDKLAETVQPILAHYREHRTPGEGFGDYCSRVGIPALQQLNP